MRAKWAQLARIGKGLASGLNWSPDGRLLAVGFSLGISLYDVQSMKEILNIDAGNYVSEVFFFTGRNHPYLRIHAGRLGEILAGLGRRASALAGRADR